MQSRYFLQLLFAFWSLILSKAQDVMGSGPSCVRSSPADDGLTRVTFLREDTAGARVLYITLWSEDMRLVTCAADTSPGVTGRYRALCDRSDTRGPGSTQRFNISMVLDPDAPCARVSSGAPKSPRRVRRDGTEGKTRRKRAWIFPGTLWCGTGSKAVGYEQLGMFESTDRCCREHDHCLHIIPAFTVNYGVFNPKFFTVSHCDCDQRFRQCLLGVNDTISSMVGYSFFNIFQVPCFELKQRSRCTEMDWWGKCKAAEEAPYAVFKSSPPFNSTGGRGKHGDKADSNKLPSGEGQHGTQSPGVDPRTGSPKSENRCSAEDPPRGDTFYPRREKGKGCKRHQAQNTVAPSQLPSISGAHNVTSSAETSLLHESERRSTLNKDRAGKKKSTRVPPQATTSSSGQTSTTPGTPSTTQTHTTLQLHLPAAVTAATKANKSHKEVAKKSGCCGSRTPPRGDTFQPHCETCLGQKATPTPSTTTPAIKATTPGTLQLGKTTQTPRGEAWSAATSAASTATKTAAARTRTTGLQPEDRTRSPNTHAERGAKLNLTLHNVTDNQLLCRSLKHLDECKYKIPPLEKKYDLQNAESKTAYHCDCTSRLAAQIESSKQPGVLPTLLMDFVSRRCFKLPKEKKCHSRKSCSRGFAKASDLLRALKKMGEKDTAGVRNSRNLRKRGIPVRLYKRCLRLQREADIMAQLTQL